MKCHTPEGFIAALLYPVLQNSLKSPGGRVFKPHPTDGASDLVDEKFNVHMKLQEDSFLVPGQHETSKKHGKLRTKFDRLVICVHLLNTYAKAFKQARDAARAANQQFDMEGIYPIVQLRLAADLLWVRFVRIAFTCLVS